MALQDFIDTLSQLAENYKEITPSHASKIVQVINENAEFFAAATGRDNDEIDEEIEGSYFKQRPFISKGKKGDQNNVFVWGCNDKSQLGLGYDNRNKVNLKLLYMLNVYLVHTYYTSSFWKLCIFCSSWGWF